MPINMDTNTILLVVMMIMLVAVFIRVGQVDQRIGQVEQEVRYDIPPARRFTIENSILAIVYGRQDKGAGVAFFVAPTVAITVAHALGKRDRRVTCIRPVDNARLEFDVIRRDAELDFAVLRLAPGQPNSPHYLTIPPHIEPVAGEKGLFLVTCNITLAGEVPDVTSMGIAWHAARIVKFHTRHFTYDPQAFDGDSGGAIVVARTGEVVGLHQELVNQAREVIEHSEDVNKRLTAVQKSIKSLIQGNALGCVGLRIDAEDVTRTLPDGLS